MLQETEVHLRKQRPAKSLSHSISMRRSSQTSRWNPPASSHSGVPTVGHCVQRHRREPADRAIVFRAELLESSAVDARTSRRASCAGARLVITGVRRHRGVLMGTQ